MYGTWNCLMVVNDDDQTFNLNCAILSGHASVVCGGIIPFILYMIKYPVCVARRVGDCWALVQWYL
jgi:hypothetical protein